MVAGSLHRDSGGFCKALYRQCLLYQASMGVLEWRALARGLLLFGDIGKARRSGPSAGEPAMNMQRRPSRATNKEPSADRRATVDYGDLLPWADPYIASLIREHERQLRGRNGPRRTRGR
jgi:hypothetical protein